MTNHPTQARKHGLRILPLVCLTLGLAVPAAAECKTYKLDIPDTDTLKLPDGEHVIASVAHEKGRLEVRVNVKSGVVSERQFFLGGKLLTKKAEAQVSKPILDCLKKLLPPGSSIADSGHKGHMFDWIVPTVYAAAPKCVLNGISCRDSVGQCCALVCCGDQCAIRCASY